MEMEMSTEDMTLFRPAPDWIIIQSSKDGYLTRAGVSVTPGLGA